MRTPRLIVFAITAPLALSVHSAIAASALAPHRAVYDLSLDDASDRSGITDIAGRMVYEFRGTPCDGYTVNFRFVTQIDTAEVSRLTDQQVTTYEDGVGENFSFVSKTFVDQNLDREIKGSATIDASATTVDLDKPESEKIELKPSRFPTRHMIEMIEKAKNSENFYETNLFDGSDEADRLMTTTVVIGKKSMASTNDPEGAAAKPLSDDGFWPVDIAYFDLSKGKGEETPTYRISFKLYENGVTRDLVMDYGDFSINGRLADLSLFEPAASCSR